MNKMKEYYITIIRYDSGGDQYFRLHSPSGDAPDWEIEIRFKNFQEEKSS